MTDDTFIEPRGVKEAWAFLSLNGYDGPLARTGSRTNILADEQARLVGFDPTTGNGRWPGVAREYNWEKMDPQSCCSDYLRNVPLPNYCKDCGTGLAAETWRLQKPSGSTDPALSAAIDDLFNTEVLDEMRS